MKKTIALLFLGCTLTGFAQEKKSKEPMFPSYKGLIMSGYQGWFRADGDEADNGWGHFGRRGKFDAENNTIDIWPDVSEY